MLKESNSLSASQGLAIPSLPALESQGVLQKTFPWAAKGGLAILDQALFSGANFIATILLARWLTPAEFGAFALAFSVFLLLGTFYTASLTEPMMVFGSGKYAGHFQEYLGILLRGHIKLMVPGVFILVRAAFVLARVYSASVDPAFYGVAFAAPFILLLWLARQAFYVQLRPGWAATGGLLYFVFLLGFMRALWTGRWLSPITALVGMGVGALIASLFLLFILGPKWTAGGADLNAKTVLIDHWRYGRWSVATAGIIWFPGNVYYVLLPIWLGLGGVGALKALQNLVMPALQSINALSLILLPVFVRLRRERGPSALASTMRSFLGLFLLGSIAYLGLLWAFRLDIFRLLYGGKYTEYALWPLVLTGVIPFGACVTAVFSNALRALERPDRIFWCYLGSAVIAVFPGIPLAATYGVTGALLGQLVSSLAAGGLMFWFCLRSLRGKSDPASAANRVTSEEPWT